MRSFGLAALILVTIAAGAVAAGDDGTILATVNGAGITRGQFMLTGKRLLQQQGLPGGHMGAINLPPDVEDKIMKILIDQELLYQEAGRRELKVSEEELAAQLDPMRGQFPTPEAFAQALRENGFTEDSFVGMLERKLSIEKLVALEVAKDVTVSDEETVDFYNNNPDQFTLPEQIRARHVLIKVPADADEEKREAARARIDAVLEEARGGAAFEELAKKYSEGPSGPEGGDLGFFQAGRMVPEFDKIAFALEPGEVSQVVQTEFGYHIIKLEERQASSLIEEAEVHQRLKEYLGAKKITEAVDARLVVLREQAEIEVLKDR